MFQVHIFIKRFGCNDTNELGYTEEYKIAKNGFLRIKAKLGNHF